MGYHQPLLQQLLFTTLHTCTVNSPSRHGPSPANATTTPWVPTDYSSQEMRHHTRDTRGSMLQLTHSQPATTTTPCVIVSESQHTNATSYKTPGYTNVYQLAQEKFGRHNQHDVIRASRQTKLGHLHIIGDLYELCRTRLAPLRNHYTPRGLAAYNEHRNDRYH